MTVLHCLRGIYAFIITLILFLVIFFPTTAVIAYRALLTLWLRYTYKGRVKLMRGMDPVFVMDQPQGIPNLTGIIYGKEGSFSVGLLQTRLSQGLFDADSKANSQHGKLLHAVVSRGGYSCWANCTNSFDIRDHVRLFEGVEYMTEGELFDYLSKLGDTMWDQDKPRWEFIKFPRVIQNGHVASVVVARVHHSYMDGISLMQILKYLMDESPPKFIFEPTSPPPLSLFKTVLLYTQAIFLGPSEARQTWKSTTYHQNSERKFIGRNTSEIQMEMIRHIRQTHGCSTQAVFHAALSSAFERWSEMKGVKVAEEILVATNLAQFPYPDETPQNRSCFVMHTIKLGNASPLGKLRKVNESLKNVQRKQYSFLFTVLVVKLVGLYPSCVAGAALKNFWCGYFLSNIPGFGGKGKVNGSEVDMVLSVPPVGNGIPFGVALTCYDNKFHVGFTISKSEMFSCRQDVDGFISHFEKELECLSHTNADEHKTFGKIYKYY